MGREVIQDELYAFLMNYFGNEDEVRKYLQNRDMFVFFRGFTGGGNSNEIETLLKKRRYEKYKKAFFQIKEVFDANGIPFVLMKGLALAEDLYGSQAYLRTFGDIDILISQSKLTSVLPLLESMGYRGTGSTSIESYLTDPNRAHHIPELTNESPAMKNVILEVHVDMVLSWIFQRKKYDTDEILQRSYINEFGIPVMDDYDAIIFMMIHILKHYAYDLVTGFVCGEIKSEFDIKAIHELALFIDKRKSTLKKGFFRERACEYGIGNELVYMCNLLKEIYPSLQSILDIDFQRDKTSGFVNRFSRAAMEMETGEILFGDKQKNIENIIAGMQSDAYKLPCYRKNEQGPGLHTKRIVMDGENFYGDNRFGSYFDVLEKPQKAECAIEFYVEWDREFFWFNGTLMSRMLSFLDCDPQTKKSIVGKQDWIRLHFDTGKRKEGEAFIRGIVLKPQYVEQDELRLFLKEDIYWNNAETVLDETEYVAEVKKETNCCKIKVGIPWDRLGYRPDSGYRFFLDVQLWKYYKDEDKHAVLSWQDAYRTWYDITTYACVELKE